MKKVYLLDHDIENIKRSLVELMAIIEASHTYIKEGDSGWIGIGEMQTIGQFMDWKEQVIHRLDLAEGP